MEPPPQPAATIAPAPRRASASRLSLAPQAGSGSSHHIGEVGHRLAPPDHDSLDHGSRSAMTLFDERERAFESLFVHEEEMRFRALAKRNQLFARWAADKLDLGGSEAQAYVRSFVDEAVRPEPAAILVSRVRSDFRTAGLAVPDEQIEEALARTTAEAARHVRTESVA